jgi:hypothetical protein
VIGWDKKATERPTTLMMVTKFSGLIVVQVEEQRYRPRALSSVPQQYLTALSVPPTCFTTPTRGEEAGRGGDTPCTRVKAELVRAGGGLLADHRGGIEPSP